MREETKKFIESVGYDGFKFSADGFGEEELAALMLAKSRLWDGEGNIMRTPTKEHCICYALPHATRDCTKIAQSISKSLGIMGHATIRLMLFSRAEVVPDNICQDYRHHLLDMLIDDTEANVLAKASQ